MGFEEKMAFRSFTYLHRIFGSSSLIISPFPRLRRWHILHFGPILFIVWGFISRRIINFIGMIGIQSIDIILSISFVNDVFEEVCFVSGRSTKSIKINETQKCKDGYSYTNGCNYSIRYLNCKKKKIWKILINQRLLEL